jgi:hypothetical protein
MTVSDERLKQRTTNAMALQSQGAFLVDQRRELPLQSNTLLNELHCGRERDERGRFFDYETSWGKFSFAPEDYSLLVLRQGRPPDSLWPQPKLELATAIVHTGYVTINNNGSSFDLDLQTRDKVDYSMLRLINQTLAAEQISVVIWALDEAQGETPPIIRIANESAMLFASSAIWSPEDQQLVATQVVTTSQDLLKAIKATLAGNNSKGMLTVKTPDDSAYLKGARRGFINASSGLTQANAEGIVTTMLHPLSGDPQANTEEHFYLVVTPEESLKEKFAERLDLAIPWPVRQEWSEYLLEAGKDARLVEVLPQAGDDFSAGLRIVKNESLWQQVISEGLKKGQIQIV